MWAGASVSAGKGQWPNAPQSGTLKLRSLNLIKMLLAFSLWSLSETLMKPDDEVNPNCSLQMLQAFLPALTSRHSGRGCPRREVMGKRVSGSKKLRGSCRQKPTLCTWTSSSSHILRRHHKGTRNGWQYSWDGQPGSSPGQALYLLFLSSSYKERLWGNQESVNLQNVTFQNCPIQRNWVIH